METTETVDHAKKLGTYGKAIGVEIPNARHVSIRNRSIRFYLTPDGPTDRVQVYYTYMHPESGEQVRFISAMPYDELGKLMESINIARRALKAQNPSVAPPPRTGRIRISIYPDDPRYQAGVPRDGKRVAP